jgi:chemotaxis protein CheC
MPDLPLLQADALRELCNICGGYAATALSRLLGDVRVELGLPEAGRMARSRVLELLGGPEQAVVTVQVELQGPVRGELLVALGEVDAAQLSGLLAHGSRAELATSALGETANIIASACLNALYRLTHLTVVPGVPRTRQGPASSLLSELAAGPESEVVVLSTLLSVSGARLHGRLLVLPDERSLGGLLQALGVPA